jgi:TnpA family transposase
MSPVHDTNTKKISQEYFNSIVKENIDDLEMEEAEAITDAIQQLESQNINLNSICKQSISEQNELWSSIDHLNNLHDKIFNQNQDIQLNKEEAIKHLKLLQTKFTKVNE